MSGSTVQVSSRPHDVPSDYYTHIERMPIMLHIDKIHLAYCPPHDIWLVNCLGESTVGFVSCNRVLYDAPLSGNPSVADTVRCKVWVYKFEVRTRCSCYFNMFFILFSAQGIFDGPYQDSHSISRFSCHLRPDSGLSCFEPSHRS